MPFPRKIIAKIQSLDLINDTLQMERALSVQWRLEPDIVQFRLEMKAQHLTRKGILSTVSSDSRSIAYEMRAVEKWLALTFAIEDSKMLQASRFWRAQSRRVAVRMRMANARTSGWVIKQVIYTALKRWPNPVSLPWRLYYPKILAERCLAVSENQFHPLHRARLR